jgi:aminoglycoside phosphotransferase (APT) family kinase protein
VSSVDALRVDLLAALRRHVAPDVALDGLRRLSGGASQETWSFELQRGGTLVPCILRRRPGKTGGPALALSLEAESRLLGVAAELDVPVPGVHFVLDAEDGLGSGYVMERLEGETIPRKILRDERFAGVRPALAYQCGEILARLHAGDPARAAELAVAPARVQLDQYRSLYDAYDAPHPVFELAFRWLEARAAEPAKLALVHGDFRNGNLLVDSRGVRGVLDWELAHIGDPMEDLGWICVPCWRFGEIDHPVGGFGAREDLFAGYAAAGGSVDAERVRFWEILGTLKWGVMCMTMVSIFRSGADPSVERAAIGRRASETEIDLLMLMEE